MKRMIAYFVSIALCLSFCSCNNVGMLSSDVLSNADTITSTTPATVTTTEPTSTAATTPQPEVIENPSVTIMCAGDNLIHSPLYKQAKERATDGRYDFDYAYQYVADLIPNVDLSILNQETIVTDAFEPSNYPFFCSPEALGDKMIDLGFDAVSISNNHCLDKGESGLLATLEYWRTAHPDIPVYGAYENEEDMNNIRVTEINDITFAFLGYMEHTNGLQLPSGSECELVYLSELELIEQQIKKADEMADFVVVSPHFGVEVTNTVTQSQKDLTRLFVEWGADLIIGTQPHTVQTMEYIEKPDGGKAFVFYCLGNFISAQSNPYSMVGMLGYLTITKDLETSEIIISDVQAVPLINQYETGSRNVRVYPFWLYDPSIVAQHGCEGVSWDMFTTIINENIPEEYLVLSREELKY